MACFLAPLAEAVVVSVIKSKAEKQEHATAQTAKCSRETVIPTSRKLGWLNKMLWGGSALLAVEHVWHGEISAQFPFLTALSSPAETQVMLNEIVTVGGVMMLVITLAWLGLVAAAELLQKKALTAKIEED